MPDPRPTRRITTAGALTAIAGTALFAWLVWKVGLPEIWTGFQKIGWGLAWIVALGGLRFAARAAAWALCVEPPHRLGFTTAFTAVVCGDAVGNVTPLGPLASEPTKIACVRDRIPIGPALTALAIENVMYTLSVGAMIAAGAAALLVSVDLPVQLREVSQIAIGVIGVLFVVVAWMLWRRPTVVTTVLPVAKIAASRIDRLRAVEREVLTFASRRRQTIVPLVGLELSFHALGVLEKHLTLWLILGTQPPLLSSFIVETADRLITVAFKFLPFQVGVGEAGTAVMTRLLGLGGSAADVTGVTVSIVRKARMGIWSLIGTALLVQRGLAPREVLADPSLTPNSSRSDS
ncbi:MAG TPA: lysylphosphatidylglycerol synthase domain-containing protein [Vicinamibacterales bacterium]|nr:lysylphosphatidylglycerol synthase domain-containing protein [Vicinamibacterales bacterium]